MSNPKSITVPEDVLEGLDYVRDSGHTNMFNRRNVIELADMAGFHATANWVENNRERYAKGITGGFEAE